MARPGGAQCGHVHPVEPMTREFDVVVIGGGIVGLSIARAVQQALPGAGVVVLEKEAAVGTHQTGHNSGVLHSGLYYRPGSLKARLCVRGREQMLDYCRDAGIPVRVPGKLVIATREREIGRLDELQARGIANGIEVERLDPAGITEYEPAAVGVAGLRVPATGVVDFGEVARRLAAGVVGAGGEVATDWDVDRIRAAPGGATVHSGERTLKGRVVVNAAGLHADRVARSAGEEPPVRIVPFRGEYYVLSEMASGLVHGLIYPVPDPRFPFLGVHYTRGIDGAVEVGPNAVLAMGREHYRGTKAQWSGLVEALGYRGFRRLARRHALGGLAEMVRSKSRALYAREARRLVPDLRSADLRKGGSGVRAQAVHPDGTLADDFVIAGDGPMLHVLSAPSPAATAALAIGDHLATMVAERLPR